MDGWSTGILVFFWGPAYFRGELLVFKNLEHWFVTIIHRSRSQNHPGRRWKVPRFDRLDCCGRVCHLGAKCFKRWKVSEMKICWFDNKSAQFIGRMSCDDYLICWKYVESGVYVVAAAFLLDFVFSLGVRIMALWWSGVSLKSGTFFFAKSVLMEGL